METDAKIGFFQRSLWRLTFIEWLLVISTTAVAVSLVIPEAKWASSGSIELPVRVMVFDAVTGHPLADARVAVVRAPPLAHGITFDEVRDRLPQDIAEYLRREGTPMTGADGTVVVSHEFRTGANHVRPAPHVHVQFAWVMVVAEGFGGVVIPIRHDSQPITSLRNQKEISVPVGLLPRD